MKKIVLLILSIILVGCCSYLSRIDFEEHVISSISSEKYDYIHQSVGGKQHDVAREYLKNKSYYDSITF